MTNQELANQELANYQAERKARAALPWTNSDIDAHLDLSLSLSHALIKRGSVARCDISHAAQDRYENAAMLLSRAIIAIGAAIQLEKDAQ